MKFRRFADGTNSKVEEKLNTIGLSSRKIQLKRVTIVNFTVNESKS